MGIDTAASGVIIRPSSEADAKAAGRVLARAFADDPHIVGLLPMARRPERMEQMFRREVLNSLRRGGHVYLAAEADAAGGEPLGVAYWGAPGERLRLADTVTETASTLRIYGRRFGDVMRTYREAERHRPKAPHWYLKVIGASPQARGRGVGSALIRHGLAQADRAGVGVYLESSKPENVPIYARYGFTEISEIPAYGTTPLIGMWRPVSR